MSLISWLGTDRSYQNVSRDRSSAYLYINYIILEYTKLEF